MAKSIRLITRGDDAGSATSADRAVLAAWREGILRNTSLLACGPTIGHAARLLSGERGLCHGFHACLTAEWDEVRWGPVLPPDQVPSLVDAQGHFPQTPAALHAGAPRLDEALAELRAQLARLRRLGFDPRYCDSHMGYEWVCDGLGDAVAEWCAREGLVYHRGLGRPLPPGASLIERLSAAEPDLYLLVTHPAYDEPEMRAMSHAGWPGERVAAERDADRRMLTDPATIAWCRAHGVELLRYDEA